MQHLGDIASPFPWAVRIPGEHMYIHVHMYTTVHVHYCTCSATEAWTLQALSLRLNKKEKSAWSTKDELSKLSTSFLFPLKWIKLASLWWNSYALSKYHTTSIGAKGTNLTVTNHDGVQGLWQSFVIVFAENDQGLNFFLMFSFSRWVLLFHLHSPPISTLTLEMLYFSLLEPSITSRAHVMRTCFSFWHSALETR